MKKLVPQNMHIPAALHIGEGTISQVSEVVTRLRYSTPLVVSGVHTWEICGRAVSEQLGSAANCQILDNTIEEVEKIRHLIARSNIDVLCAVGGGKVIDICQYAAYLEGIDVILIPTAPSHDGLCSPVAVVKCQNNNVSRSLKARMPIGVICDLNILRNVPDVSFRARSGIGDLISNLSAVQDWQLAYEDGFEAQYSGFAVLLAKNSAKNFFEVMKGKSLTSKELLESLVEGLVFSGIAMGVAGSSRPSSGAEHLFSHALDELYGGIASHGVQVAVGTILVTCLRNQNWRDYVEFFGSFGMPLNCESLGVSEEQVINALLHGPRTRPGRYTILDKVRVTKQRAEEVARMTGVI